MKNLLFVVLAAAFAASGCGVTIGSPLLGQMGHSASGETVVITNMGGNFCDLVSGRKSFALDPGQVAYDTRHYTPQYWAQVPVAAVCFADPAKTVFAGATGIILNFNGYGYPGPVQSWDIPPMGETRAISPYAASILSRRVKLPRSWLNGIAVAQAVNASLGGEAVLLLDGRVLDPVWLPGDVVTITERLSGGQHLFTAIFTREGRLVGKEEMPFYAPLNGVYAAQFIAGRGLR